MTSENFNPKPPLTKVVRNCSPLDINQQASKQTNSNTFYFAILLSCGGIVFLYVLSRLDKNKSFKQKNNLHFSVLVQYFTIYVYYYV